MSGVVVLLSVGLITPIFYYIPNAALAAIIMASVTNLINFGEMVYAWRSGYRADAFVMVITFLMTLCVGIVQGIGLGTYYADVETGVEVFCLR